MGVCKDFNKNVVIREYVKELMNRDNRLGLSALESWLLGLHRQAASKMYVCLCSLQ